MTSSSHLSTFVSFTRRPPLKEGMSIPLRRRKKALCLLQKTARTRHNHSQQTPGFVPLSPARFSRTKRMANANVKPASRKPKKPRAATHRRKEIRSAPLRQDENTKKRAKRPVPTVPLCSVSGTAVVDPIRRRATNQKMGRHVVQTKGRVRPFRNTNKQLFSFAGPQLAHLSPTPPSSSYLTPLASTAPEFPRRKDKRPPHPAPQFARQRLRDGAE